MLTFTLEPGLAGLGYSCNTAILKHFQGFFFSLWECQMKLLELEGIINQLPYYSHHDRWAFRFFFFCPFFLQPALAARWSFHMDSMIVSHICCMCFRGQASLCTLQVLAHVMLKITLQGRNHYIHIFIFLQKI